LSIGWRRDRDLKRINDLNAAKLSGAASFASLAAVGQCEDAAKRGDQEKTRLRKQALDWIRADLPLRARQLESAQAADRAAARRALRHWQQDTGRVRRSGWWSVRRGARWR